MIQNITEFIDNHMLHVLALVLFLCMNVSEILDILGKECTATKTPTALVLLTFAFGVSLFVIQSLIDFMRGKWGNDNKQRANVMVCRLKSVVLLTILFFVFANPISYVVNPLAGPEHFLNMGSQGISVDGTNGICSNWMLPVVNGVVFFGVSYLINYTYNIPFKC
uniref:Uncharacterized protein n=1 Tax=Megaviridae environmental sample TaxID=1737588 RepID=A0A5J6VIR7_9VIRU|nr:MAG: hypothetical protein [Megaviridae environmental sample]